MLPNKYSSVISPNMESVVNVHPACVCLCVSVCLRCYYEIGDCVILNPCLSTAGLMIRVWKIVAF